MTKRKKIKTPDSVDILLARGSQHLEDGRYLAALREFQLAHDSNPRNPEVLFKIGLTYDYLTMFQQALDHYHRALALAPDMEGAWEYSGVVHHKLRQYERAIACYNEAIKLDPDYPYAYYNKALTLGAMGQFVEAIDCYDQAISLDPKYGLAYTNKGIKLNSLGKYEQAVETLRLAVRYDKQDPRAFFALGKALLALRRNVQAFRNCERGLALDPNNAKEWRMPERPLFEQNDTMLLRQRTKRSCELYSGTPGIYYCIADSMRHQNKYAEAKDYIKKGLRRYPSDKNLPALLQSLKLQLK